MAKRGRNVDGEVERAFKKFKTTDSIASRAKCHACGFERSWHTTELRHHLTSCKKYLISVGLEQDGEKKMQQLKLHIPAIGPRQQFLIRKQFALAAIMDGLPFNVYDKQKKLYAAINTANPMVKLPTEREIAGELLDEIYADTQAKIAPLIKSAPLINFIADESSNIRRQRVQNLCISIIEYGAFYNVSEALRGETLDAAWTANWLDEQMTRVCEGNFKKINSVATDTCATQRKASELLAAMPQFRHVFFVPCDSHGLQLLMKDILNVPWFKERLAKVKKIVTAFINSPKQLGILRERMEKTMGKQVSFALSVITRWGTQVAMIRSVQRVLPALQDFYTNMPPDCPAGLRDQADVVWNLKFWQDVGVIMRLIGPIDELVKKSEADKAILAYVIPRWKQALVSIRRSAAECQQDVEIANLEERVFKPRFLRQTSGLHVAAHFLNPNSVGDEEIPFMNHAEIIASLDSVLERQVEDKVSAMKVLWEFRKQEGNFYRGSHLWDYKREVKTFWENAKSSAPALATFAIRLASTPANSVPSERSFSALNLLQDKKRNRLDPVRVDKLQYIYINERALQRSSVARESEQELVELEDKLILAGEDDTTNPQIAEDGA